MRFVQIYMGSGSKWDAHANVEGNHTKHCRESDKPIAGLVKDLKRRGFSFVGSTVMYAHMQAVGMVNDHLVGCFRYRRVARTR